MTSDDYVPKKYTSLESQGYAGSPSHGGYAPRQHSLGRSSVCCGCLRCCCCCCSCCRCCICSILIILLILVALVLGLYYLIKPIIPSYNVESFKVVTFDVKNSNRVYTDIVVVMKAENPNEGVGLDYLENEIRLIYAGTQLSSGQFPSFLQPGKNISMLNVELKGEAEFDDELQNKFIQDDQAEYIPLLITVRLPIRLVLDDLIHLKKFVVYVNCSLIIDQVDPKKQPNILEKHFTYAVEF
ncbi:hypothetical protein RJT34_28899 [Clitoria ternatea]|uniref:Late embryogenesis abundant protein LEA-2 subgroup domain-containing protein n=1 Tax=Clitoria ternatea TaxID=43366 RepID=A0AAN9FBU5_CLITE